MLDVVVFGSTPPSPLDTEAVVVLVPNIPPVELVAAPPSVNPVDVELAPPSPPNVRG